MADKRLKCICPEQGTALGAHRLRETVGCAITRPFLGVLALVLAAVPALALYTPRAVEFPPGTYLVTGPIADSDLSPSFGSTDGLVCLWYNSSHPPIPNTQATLIRASWRGHGQIFNLTFAGFNTFHTALELFLQDLGKHWVHAATVESLPFDGHWHFIGLTWSVAQPLGHGIYPISAVLDRNILSWRMISDGTNSVFRVPYRMADFWTVGGDQDAAGRGFGFYRGLLSQVYMHVGVSDYYSILNPKRGFPGCAQINPDGQFGPSELGPNGSGPFGPIRGPLDYLPILHLAGGIDTFKKNQGGATSFKLSPNSPSDIRIAPSDPWELYR